MARRAYPASEVIKSVVTSPEGDEGKAPPASPKRRGRKPKYVESEASSTETKDEEEDASKAEPVPSGLDDVSKASGNLWIGLPIPESVARALAIEGGEPAEKLHVTLCFSQLSMNIRGFEPDSTVGGGIEGIRSAVEEIAKKTWPFTARIGGIGRFNASNSSDGKDVFYASADIPGLSQFREQLVNIMEKCGYYQSSDHGYFPHVTLAYIEQDADLPAQRVVGHEFEVDELHLMLGQERHTYHLGIRKTSKCIEFVEKSAEKRLVTGIVLQPEVTDAQGDIISEDAITQAAHKFLANYNRATELGIQHKDFPPGISLVESWVAPSPLMIGGRHIKKGTWIMTVKVSNDEIWSQVKSGALSGFSIRGTAKVQPLKN